MGIKKMFHSQDEQAFKESEQFLQIRLLRTIFLVFALLYGLFAFPDLYYYPNEWKILFILRFGIVIPLLISTVILSYTKYFIKIYQPYIAINVVIGGSVIAYMLILQPGNIVYYGGLFMIYFSAYFLVKLRFYYATVSGWLVFSFHALGTMIIRDDYPDIFYFGILFYMGSNIIGMVGAYNLESLNRSQFLRDKQITYINEELKKQYAEKDNQLTQLEQSIQENRDLVFRHEEKNRLTNKLRQIEERFEQLSQQSRTFVYEFNLEGLYTYVSSSVQSILGYKAEDIVNKMHFYDLFPEAQREEYKRIGFELMIKEQVISDFTNPMQTADGTIIWVSSYVVPVHDSEGKLIAMRGSDMDITAKKQTEEEITYISYHDYLTEIPNRRYFQEQLVVLDQEVNYPLCIAIMDVNGLKVINDAYGHSSGNIALKQVAKALSTIKRESDVIARIGGDEFAIICPNTSDEEMEKMRESLKGIIAEQRVEDIQYSLAIGIEIKTQRAENIRDILKEAENKMYSNKVLEGKSTRNQAILSILHTLTTKYNEEKVHSERVAKYCKALGKCMQLRDDEVKELELAGALHDIGKISIPDSILDKPDKLDPDEWSVMMQHTVNGYQILRAADSYSNLAEYAMSHHERIDGKGYPHRLKNKAIPLFARIISVADAYEAMTSDRPYRKAMDKDEAIKELKAHAGTQFDASIVKIFIEKVLAKES